MRLLNGPLLLSCLSIPYRVDPVAVSNQPRNVLTSDIGRSNSFSIPVVRVTVSIARSPDGSSGVGVGSGVGSGVGDGVGCVDK